MSIYNKIHHIVTFRLKRLKAKVNNSKTFFKVKVKLLLPLGLYDSIYLKAPLEEGWLDRIDDVLKCPDNKYIERQPNAGTVKNGKQVMHNGIVITLGGYYGEAITQMLFKNKGVHEPQEEMAFSKVLNEILEGGTMIELGSYWSFYSLWFNREIKEAKNYMVEPEEANINYGINNFRLNKLSGNFTKAFVGSERGVQNGIPVICVDDFVKENNISFVDILHSDIQGFEYQMLLGATNTLRKNKIGYLFISTHGNEVHYKCIDYLKSQNYRILCAADEFETYSLDGLIVAKSNQIEGIDNINISLKPKSRQNCD